MFLFVCGRSETAEAAERKPSVIFKPDIIIITITIISVIIIIFIIFIIITIIGFFGFLKKPFGFLK